MKCKLSSGVLSIFDTDSITFVDVFKGRRFRVGISVDKDFFDRPLDTDLLSPKQKFLVDVLMKKKYMISCAADESNRIKANSIINGVEI